MAVLTAVGATPVGRLRADQAGNAFPRDIEAMSRAEVDQWISQMAPAGGDGDGRLARLRTAAPLGGLAVCSDEQDVAGAHLAGDFDANVRSRIVRAVWNAEARPASEGIGRTLLAVGCSGCFLGRVPDDSPSGAALGSILSASLRRQGALEGPRAPVRE